RPLVWRLVSQGGLEIVEVAVGDVAVGDQAPGADFDRGPPTDPAPVEEGVGPYRHHAAAVDDDAPSNPNPVAEHASCAILDLQSTHNHHAVAVGEGARI